MAAVTLLGSTFNTNSGTKTVTATPAAGDLIVVITAHTGNTSTADATDDQGGTYFGSEAAGKNTFADKMEVFVRNSLIESAETIFSHAPGASSGGGLAVFAVSGGNRAGTLAIVRGGELNNQSAGTPVVTLTGAAQASNPIVAAVFNATNPAALSPPSGWTEHADVGYASPTTGLQVVSRDSGEMGSAITWGSSSASDYCALVLELDARLTLFAGLVTNTQTFYSPTATGGVPLIRPALLTNTQIFYSPTVVAGSVAIDPPLVTNTQTFHAATVSASNTLEPSLLTNTQTFHGPAIAAGALAIFPLFLNNASAIYAPVISGGLDLAEIKRRRRRRSRAQNDYGEIHLPARQQTYKRGSDGRSG